MINFSFLWEVIFKPGDKVILTTWDGRSYRAEIQLVTPLMHECDDDICNHRILAAVYSIASLKTGGLWQAVHPIQGWLGISKI